MFPGADDELGGAAGVADNGDSAWEANLPAVGVATEEEVEVALCFAPSFWAMG